MNDNRSVATIDAPEFINLEPYNPLISKCQIKVLYVGENRNGSFIDKNTAIQMANSLPGTPIVGAYREDIEDFGDHGHIMTIEDGEIKFSVKTKPYGFVAPDARVWFQKFTDTDEFGNDMTHEYMMTTGYLWTGQYQEAMSVIENGKGQSMELDEDTLDGHWARNSKTGVEFFIINDAVFSKLCILGDAVEPCFEGANVTALTDEYSTDADFSRSLYTMMNELKDALADEGGLKMPKDQTENTKMEKVVVEEKPVEPVELVEPAAEVAPAIEVEGQVEETVEPSHGPVTMSSLSEDSSEFENKKKDEEEQTDEQTDEDDASDSDEEDSKDDAPQDDNEDDKKKKTQHSLDDSLMAELEELRAFKLSIENEKKDALINKYHMLSDDDKASIVAHKEEYSLEQIDEKLALIYVRKNVDFDTVDGKPEVETEVSPMLAFSLDDDGIVNTGEAVDAVQEALREYTNR